MRRLDAKAAVREGLLMVLRYHIKKTGPEGPASTLPISGSGVSHIETDKVDAPILRNLENQACRHTDSVPAKSTGSYSI